MVDGILEALVCLQTSSSRCKVFTNYAKQACILKFVDGKQASLPESHMHVLFFRNASYSEFSIQRMASFSNGLPSIRTRTWKGPGILSIGLANCNLHNGFT